MSSLIDQAQKNYNSGDYDGAMDLCKRVLKSKVDFDALRILALSLHNKKRFIEAIDFFNLAFKVNSKNLELRLDKASTLIKLAHSLDNSYFIQAYKLCKEVLKEDPTNLRANRIMFMINDTLCFYNNAEKHLKVNLANNPRAADVNYDYFSFLMTRGEFEKANEVLEATRDFDPLYCIDYNWNKINKGYDPAERIESLRSIVAGREIPEHFRAIFYMSLAQAYEKKKDTKQAIRYFNKANNLKRKLLHFNLEAHLEFFEYLHTNITKEFLQRFKSVSRTKDRVRNIFIVGMPRSGSTLVETILTTHDDVSGLGEINDFKEAILSPLQNKYPEAKSHLRKVAFIQEEDVEAIRERYLRQVIKKNSRTNKGKNSKFIVNKMLTNYYFVPLIKVLYPDAIIIHTKRDPMSTCWSCYKHFFIGDNDYVYNLEELGHYYNAYRRLMANWHEIMPGQIYDLDYEELIANPEAEIRKLIEYCDLPWDAKCLDFHENVSGVKTASLVQVRQPIYKTANQAWAQYDEYLGDLKRILEIE